VKIILGGTSNSRDLQDLSTLIGQRDEYTDSVTLGDHGSRSNQRSIRRVPILPPDRIRTLPFGTGVTLLRSAPPIITDLRAWTPRPDSAQLKEERAGIGAQLRRPADSSRCERHLKRETSCSDRLVHHERRSPRGCAAPGR
jgi:type IV secretion system protein VirD4